MGRSVNTSRIVELDWTVDFGKENIQAITGLPEELLIGDYSLRITKNNELVTETIPVIKRLEEKSLVIGIPVLAELKKGTQYRYEIKSNSIQQASKLTITGKLTVI